MKCYLTASILISILTAAEEIKPAIALVEYTGAEIDAIKEGVISEKDVLSHKS